MLAFFILAFLYFLIIPVSYLQIQKRLIKKISGLRKIVLSKNSAHIIHDAISGIWIDEEKILYAFSKNIDCKFLRRYYGNIFNKDLVEELKLELTSEMLYRILGIINGKSFKI